MLIHSNTILEGEGEKTILKAEDSFTGSQFITNSDFDSGNRNIVIRNLKIEIALPQLDGDEPGILRFENVELLEIDNLTMVIDSPLYGIDLSANVHSATVQRCTITNTNRVSGGGIMIRNGDPRPAEATSGIVVRDNRIESVSDEPLAVFGWKGMTENIRIEKNTILAQGASFGITAYGIDSVKHTGKIQNVRIVGNVISGSRIGGIGIKGGAQFVEVADNVLKDPKGDGIFLHTGGEGLPSVHDIRIYQNKITNAGRHCIFSTGAKIHIEKNEIRNCAQAGIYVAGDVSVINNVITYAKPGILVDGPQRNDIRGNDLRNAGKIVILSGAGSVSK
jgi:hypothetical protein